MSGTTSSSGANMNNSIYDYNKAQLTQQYAGNADLELGVCGNENEGLYSINNQS